MEYDVKMGESRKEDERIGRKPERMLPRSYDLTDGVIPIHQVAPGVTPRQLRGCQKSVPLKEQRTCHRHGQSWS